ncbi:MAG: DUF1826 domain-containing protein [Erythrobacter sp.]|jgi:hypothetical protein|nr:DUF1826 domain-containing protein [Erythrobacter sp.]
MSTLLRPAARIATSPDVLGRIGEDECNLAIWQRPAFADLAPLVAGTPDDLRFDCGLAGLPGLLRSGLVDHGFGGGNSLHKELVTDATLLATLFCKALGLERFELRLEVVRTDSCRKFHADYVSARLITTYVGEGTDWLDGADAARVAAGEEPQRINRMHPFDVGLFKGKLASDHPAIHRSPPIAGTGAARLLMVLNPAQKQFVDSGQSPVS